MFCRGCWIVVQSSAQNDCLAGGHERFRYGQRGLRCGMILGNAGSLDRKIAEFCFILILRNNVLLQDVISQRTHRRGRALQ